MRVRHRIPSIFNLSMVDVLCCALGCVILLWLLNLREAKYHQDNAREKDRKKTALLAGAQRDRDDAYGRVKSLDVERDRLRRQVAELQSAVADLEGKYRVSAARSAALGDDLHAARQRQEVQASKIAEGEDKLKLAEARMRDLQATASLVPGLRADILAARRKYADEET